MLKQLSLLLIPFLLSGFCIEDSSVQLQVGGRRDQIHVDGWNWNRINIVETALVTNTQLDNNLYLEADGSYGWVLQHHSSDGKVYDVSAALGYPLNASCVTVTPLIGYAIQEDRLNFHNMGYFIVRDNVSIWLKGHYNQKWQGPWIGMQAETNYGRWDFLLRGEYHYAQLRGNEGYHFGEFLKTHNHYSQNDAYGIKVKVGINYQITHCFKIGLLGTYARFAANNAHGSAHINVLDINQNVYNNHFTAQSRTNLNSYGLRGVVEYTF